MMDTENPKERGVEFSGLARLGKVAGVLGVALGVVAVLLHESFGTLGLLPDADRAWVVLVVAVLAAVLIGLAIVAFVSGARAGGQTAESFGAGSAVTNVDKRKAAAASQSAVSHGDNSPVSNSRG
jgi:hypothetical protein